MFPIYIKKGLILGWASPFWGKKCQKSRGFTLKIGKTLILEAGNVAYR